MKTPKRKIPISFDQAADLADEDLILKRFLMDPASPKRGAARDAESGSDQSEHTDNTTLPSPTDKD